MHDGREITVGDIVRALAQSLGHLDYVSGYQEDGTGYPCETLHHLEGAVIGVLDIGAAEKLIEDNQHPAPGSDKHGHAFETPYLGIEMAVSATDVVRKVDCRAYSVAQ